MKSDRSMKYVCLGLSNFIFYSSLTIFSPCFNFVEEGSNNKNNLSSKLMFHNWGLQIKLVKNRLMKESFILHAHGEPQKRNDNFKEVAKPEAYISF